MINLGDAVLFFKGDRTDLDSKQASLEGDVKSRMDRLSGFATKTGVAMTAMGASITGALGLSLAAWSEQENAVAQLDAVLKSTNGVAGITRESMLGLAKSLQETTTYSDETVVSAENFLLTFTNIKNDVMPDAVKIVLDMSTAMGTDLKGSAIQVGKALQDPIKGVSALAEVGVNFTLQQQEQIKKLVETGHAMEAQKLILKELSTEFGGSAAAAAQTFSGQLAQLKNAVGEVFEAIGNALTGGGGAAGLISWLKDAAYGTANWIQTHPVLVGWIVKLAAAVGVFMTVAGPLLIMLPGVVALFGMLGGGAAVAGAGAAVGGAAIGGGVLAATATGFIGLLGPIALVLGALALVAPLIIACVRASNELKEANAQQAESESRLSGEVERYINWLAERGVAVDRAALAQMTSEEQIAALNQQYAAAREAGQFQELAALKEKEKAQSDASWAAIEALGKEDAARQKSVGVAQDSTKQVSDVYNRWKDEHATLLQGVELDQVVANTDMISEWQKYGLATKEQVEMIREQMKGLSPATRHSPSINDLVFAGFAELNSGMEGVFGTLSGIAGKIAGVFSGIQGAIEFALGIAGGGGVGGNIEGRAIGGPVQAGQVYKVEEIGPEIFVPSVPGTIVPLGQSAKSMSAALAGGGGGGFTFNYNGNMIIREEADIDKVSRRLFDMVKTSGRR